MAGLKWEKLHSIRDRSLAKDAKEHLSTSMYDILYSVLIRSVYRVTVKAFAVVIQAYIDRYIYIYIAGYAYTYL